MKKFKFTIEGENYEVSVNEEGKNTAEVTVNGKTFLVEIEEENIPNKKPSIISPKKTQSQTSSNMCSGNNSPVKKATGNSRSIKSPLPGNITKIAISSGQTVKRGNLLLVMESMKMENNILADKDGIVKDIYVQTGQSVLQGDPLIDLE